ncbi:molybdenum cofactor synthesis 2 [Thelephora ganbajun]|uniref:Molybdenum cofactor synthesis 2 n=1 Tax=Thelephora ganbajun TaxID=370292 RepID=A0ACB6Z4G3_THEGA|nr:molybdenum cofactor synthesis 2 [Thelephora ganbajun]
MSVTSDSQSSLNPPASVAVKLEIPEGTFVLTYDKLDSETVIQSVQDDTAGAIAVFIGTTRNSFQGQVVARLEYQAYSRMAVKTMTDVFLSVHANATRSEHAVPSRPPVSPLLHCAVHHRLGVVPVGEASIVIAVSSPHRKEAFVACEYLLEQVKLKVPIWKKEVYESGEPRWKANHLPPA